MAKLIMSDGLASDLAIPADYPGTVLEKAIGGHGYIVAVMPASLAEKSGYVYACFLTAAHDKPKNLRADIWMGHGTVNGPVVFLAESELYGLVGEKKVELIEKLLEKNRNG